MAIEKNNFKVSRLDSEISPNDDSGEMDVSSDDYDVQLRSSAVEYSDEDDEFDDADSGAGSDDYDLLELGETGAEFCQTGNQTCSVPFELYDLSGLEDILSVDVWNECLSEEDKFELAKYLPNMDEDAFSRTLKDLFTGHNFHFGSPISKLFDMLKGGLCEPRVALYREGLNYFQKRQHYHSLRTHQNNMVSGLCQIRDGWLNCREYSIAEKLQVLNIMKSQNSLMYEKTEDLETDSSESLADAFLSKKIKDRKTTQKSGRSPTYDVDSNMGFPSSGQPLVMEPTILGKQNLKGILKTAGSRMGAANELVERFTSVHHGSSAAPSRHSKAAGYVSGGTLRTRDQMRFEDDAEDPIYGRSNLRGHNFSRGSLLDKSGVLKTGKKHDFLRGEELAGDSYMGLPLSSKNDSQVYGRSKITANPSNMRLSYELSKKARNPVNAQDFAVGDQMKSLKGRSAHAEPFWPNRSQGEVFSVGSSFQSDDWNYKSKKWKAGRESPDFSLNKSYKPPSQQINDRFFHPELRATPSQGKIRGKFLQSGRQNMMVRNKRNEETESDSSEQNEDDEDTDPMLSSRVAYRSSKSSLDSKNGRFIKENAARALEGISRSSRKMDSFGEPGYMLGGENYSMKEKQKAKVHANSPLYFSGGRFSEDKFHDDDDYRPLYKSSKNSQLQGVRGEKSQRKHKQEASYVRDYNDEEDNSMDPQFLVDDNRYFRMGKRGQGVDTYVNDHRASLLGCNSARKKRNGMQDVIDVDESYGYGNLPHPVDGSGLSKRKGKRKLEADAGMPVAENSELPIIVANVEPEPKPQKKPFVLITPTVHTGFSFSVVQLLSAVRMAMITPLPEYSLEGGKCTDGMNENAGVQNSDHTEKVKVLSLTLPEIVTRVRSNPGDPCILEMQEPLSDLVRGVMKIFSSKTAPLGAKGWKTLVSYEKSNKTWSWIGPALECWNEPETPEEVTSPDFWGIPHKTLVKLVDSFANWLKSGQETLRQIGSLPAPPASLLEFNLDEKERFKDLRAQKSLNTFGPSSEEVREYFRKEEMLRYSIPDRAFSYTAADGKKSIVAPLRRCGGKPTSKARDHFMLKRDRPPHVTILCLVRDAAARLPGSIGTRADVCTLIRDSQYVVEDVADTQITQIVSGALDRLHYERDPCVQFHGDRKLWVYLHRDREEEDFDDDGTSSTKKWKRQKKDPAEQEQPEQQGAVTVAFHGSAADQPGFDLGTEPPSINDDKRAEMVSGDVKERTDDINHGFEPDNINNGHLMVWEDPIRENKLSANEDFDDETFVKEGMLDS